VRARVRILSPRVQDKGARHLHLDFGKDRVVNHELCGLEAVHICSFKILCRILPAQSCTTHPRVHASWSKSKKSPTKPVWSAPLFCFCLSIFICLRFIGPEKSLVLICNALSRPYRRSLHAPGRSFLRNNCLSQQYGTKAWEVVQHAQR
jgi:hypothetical protein